MRRGLVIALLICAPMGWLAARAVPLPRPERLVRSFEPGPGLPTLPRSGPDQPAPATSGSVGGPARPRQRHPIQRGVALGLFAEDVSFSYEPLLREIAGLGATHVALIVPIYQTHGGSTHLYRHTRFSPTLETVADTIRQAHRASLEVTVFPIVRLAAPRTPREWRGTLEPADRDAWFTSYGEQLGDLASLAELTGATRLVVGSELSTLDGDLPRWQHLIALVRAVFTGTLVYSANWDHYRDARLFELVDEVGVVGYFGLRDHGGPSDVPALTASWQRIRRELDAALAKYGKPFVFTELGYRSRSGATTSPWDESAGGKPDLDEQRRGLEAFRQAYAVPEGWQRRIDGLYIWNWYGYGGPGTTGYTPRGKPAEATVRQILLDLERQ
jgi:hypothetical protein